MKRSTIPTFEDNQFDSVFNPNFLQTIRETLASDLEIKVEKLEEDFTKNVDDNSRRLEIRIRQFSIASILVESYLMRPLLLVSSLKQLAEEYSNQGYKLQTYQHSVEALNKYKIYSNEINDNKLQEQLYVNLCESCYANRSFREALYYVQEYYKRGEGKVIEDNPREGLSCYLQILAIHGKTLYKIGECKESEKTLQKCLENLEQLRGEEKARKAKEGKLKTDSETNEQYFTYQTGVLTCLQKINKKDGNYIQMEEYIKQILRCCEINEKFMFEKSVIFPIKVKFWLLHLDYFDIFNQTYFPVQKLTNRVLKATPEFLGGLSLLLVYLNRSLENELGLLLSIRETSTFPKLVNMLERQTVYFFDRRDYCQMFALVRVLTSIFGFMDEQASFNNCVYFLLKELLRIVVESDWSEEWKTTIKCELRTVQKMARIIKNSFLKNLSKGFYNEIDNLKANEPVKRELLGNCETSIKNLMEKMEKKVE